MTEKQQTTKSHVFFITILLIVGIILIYFFIHKQREKDYQYQLEEVKTLLSLEQSKSNYVGVNQKQIFKVTKDGVRAYGLDGEQKWTDTLTFDQFVVKQKEPYFAVSDKLGQTVIVFNDKGRQAEIKCQNPITYFSINSNGYVTIIEKMKDSHVVSAYDNKGNHLGVKRITYPKDNGYPIVAEISPNNKTLLISYVKLDEPTLTSSILAISIDKPTDENLNQTLYGIEQKDNLVYMIQFVNHSEWASIGDKNITWYNLEGNEIGKVDNLYLTYQPYLVKTSTYGQGYLPTISTTSSNKYTIHRKDTLQYFDSHGKMNFKYFFESGITYFYADDKGVVVEEKNVFTGYNKVGTKLFIYKPIQDIEKVIFLPDEKKGIGVNKDEVVLLKPKK